MVNCSLSKLIKEGFTSPYELSHGMFHNPPKIYEYEFQNKSGLTYVSEFAQQPTHYDFEFAVLYDADGNSIDRPMNITNTGDQFRIFSTVLKSFDMFIEQRPGVRVIKFTAESPSRKKLYERLVKTLAKKHGVNYDIDKTAGWKWLFYIKHPRNFKHFYNSENEETITPANFKRFQNWVKKNLYTYTQSGKSSILTGGIIKSIKKQPNPYSKMIRNAAFKMQQTNEGFIKNAGNYTIYAIEVEQIPIGSEDTTSPFNKKGVWVQIDENKNTGVSTLMIQPTTLQTIKDILDIK